MSARYLICVYRAGTVMRGTMANVRVTVLKGRSGVLEIEEAFVHGGDSTHVTELLLFTGNNLWV